MCDSTDVDKAIMAPNVKTTKKKQIPDDYMVMGESAEQILLYFRKVLSVFWTLSDMPSSSGTI